MLLDVPFAIARSGLPSLFTSRVAMKSAPVPFVIAMVVAALNVPVPVPVRIENEPDAFAVMRSAKLSWLKSSVATARGEVPTALFAGARYVPQMPAANEAAGTAQTIATRAHQPATMRKGRREETPLASTRQGRSDNLALS